MIHGPARVGNTRISAYLRRVAGGSSAAEDGRLLTALAAVTPVTVELSQPLSDIAHSFRMDQGSGVMVCTRSG
jgi:hypothetical protein